MADTSKCTKCGGHVPGVRERRGMCEECKEKRLTRWRENQPKDARKVVPDVLASIITSESSLKLAYFMAMADFPVGSRTRIKRLAPALRHISEMAARFADDIERDGWPQSIEEVGAARNG
jgi:hypothetical protein